MNKKRLAVLTTLVAISLSGGLVYAAPADDAVDTREVVVTATRHAEEVKAVPSAVEVITAEDIKAIGADNLTSALRMATNLNLSEAGMVGNAVQLRGMNTAHTLILIDGKRMTGEDAQNTQNVYQLNRINLSEVERVEIVRGASSALYGSEAMGGVINIITKQPEKAQTTVGLSTGSKEMANWYRFDLGKQGKLSASFDMRFSKVRQQYDGTEDSNMYGPKQYFGLDLGYDLGNTKELRFQANYLKERLSVLSPDNYNPRLGFLQKDQRDSYENDSKSVSLEYTGKTQRGDYQLRTYYNELEKDFWRVNKRDTLSEPMESIMNAVYPRYDFDKTKYKQFVVEGRNTMQLNDEHLLTFGGEYRYDYTEGTRLGVGGSNVTTVTQNGLFKDSSEASSNAFAGYIQDEWMIGDKLLLIPALRYDHHNAYGTNISPKLGLTYNMNDDVRIKANYGKGFKAPTLYELHAGMRKSMGGALINLDGNPNLEPEKSTNYDISIEAEKGNTFGKLTYFVNDVKNLITEDGVYTYDDNGNLTRWDGTYINVAKADIKGIEAEVRQKLNDYWTASVVHTYLDAIDESKNSRLSGRAKNITSLRLEYNDHKEDAFGMMLWNDYVSDYRYNNKDRSYNMANICFTKQFGDYEAYFGVDNIFNKEIDDLYIDGRQWRLGVSVTL